MTVRFFRKKNPAPTATGRHEIGVLFDIDGLGGGFYGLKAYRILFRSLDPKRLIGCYFHDGDTNATINGGAREYCVVIQATTPETIGYVRTALSPRTDDGLYPVARRFLEGDITDHEPLVPAGAVNRAGNLVVRENDMLQPGPIEGTPWTVVVG